MWFKPKAPKRSDDEPFLIAHVIRGSGSVSSLLHFVNNHPAGADAARKDIIKIKYWYSKCSPVVQNIVRKMVTSFEKFDVEEEEWRGLFNDDLTQHFKVTDRDTKLWFRFDTSKPSIDIQNDGILSKDRNDWTIFVYATRSVLYIQKNIETMRKSQRTEQAKNQYLESYQ